MSRTRLILLSIVVGAAIYLGGTWIANNTEWVEHTVAMPPKGEAATNPFYASQRFAEELGATTTWDRIFIEPSADAVIVLSTWQWDMSAGRRRAMERWVENGGRLVVDSGLWGGVEEFERWAGISWQDIDPCADESSDDEECGEHEDVESERASPSEGASSSEADTSSEETPSAEETTDDEDEEGEEDGEGLAHDVSAPFSACEEYREERGGVTMAGGRPLPPRMMCSVHAGDVLHAQKPLEWALRGAKGLYVARVRVGRGSVTVVNGSPFRARRLFDGDQAWLLVHATQMARGDEIHFLSEDESLGLLALAWLYGWPVILISGLVIALLLWRGGVRFGPLVAAPELARRSLAEQIRGTGQFVLRGGGAPLHAAMVRALEETVRKRIKGFGDLSSRERLKALESVIGDRTRAASLNEAMYGTDVALAAVLRRALARIEAARRHLNREDTKSSRSRTT